jgi:hypothetical protein
MQMFQFIEFAETDKAFGAVETVGTAFIDRIVTSEAGGQIASLEDLVRFAKERYPDDDAAHAWKVPLDKPYGLNAMRKLWAAYLHWGEVTHNAYVDVVKKERGNE